MPIAEPLLSGLRVVDLSDGVAGPFCAKLLGDFGAEVIKLERPDGGDHARRLGPFPDGTPDPNRAGLFSYLNAGKLGGTLDLDSPDAPAQLDTIADWATVLVDDGRLGQRFGGTIYDALLERKPDLVILSVTPLGLDGPYATYAATELTALALGGFLSLCGDQDHAPLKPHGWLLEFQTGYDAALAAIAAVLQAEMTGLGEHVDVAMLDAANFLLADVPGEEQYRDVRHRRNGSRNTTPNPTAAYPSTVLPCADGWVHVHFGAPHALGAFLDAPELNEPPLSTEPKGHAAEIDAVITSRIADRDKLELTEDAQASGLAFTPVLEPLELLTDLHHQETQFLVSALLPDGTSITVPGVPFRFEGLAFPEPSILRAPGLGEHDALIWSRIAALHPAAGRVVGERP